MDIRISGCGNYYPHKTFAGSNNNTALKNQAEHVAELAKRELSQISSNQKVSDSQNAWWRYGYKTAVEELKNLTVKTDDKEAASSDIIKKFHDFSEEGLI